MRYWIISELFYPEEVSTGYVMTKIAEKLSETVEVGVICGPANYQSDVLEAKYKLSDKILINRVNTPRFDKNKPFQRILGFILLTFGVGIKILTSVKKEDKVILVTNPPTLLPLISLLKKIISFQFVIIVHDVFPENAKAVGIFNGDSILYKLVLSVFNLSYRAANKVITVGIDMKELFQQKIGVGTPLSVITNWADHDEIFPIREDMFNPIYCSDPKSKVVIQFAGNMGRVQGLDLLFEQLSMIENPNYELVLIGDGAQKQKLLEFVNEHHFEQVKFISSRPRTEQNHFLNSCDIGLVTLTPGMFGLGVPSKIYNIFSAGKPVVYIGDPGSEISRYIVENNAGWFFSWDDKVSIRDFFTSIGPHFRDEIAKKGKNARLLVEQKFTKDFILEQYRSEIVS